MSRSPAPDEMQAIDYLHWRDEILQVMYWMLGEGLGAQPNVLQIEAFLGADPTLVRNTLGRMASEGFIREVAEGSFRLTDVGLTEGKRSFSDEFRNLTHQGHGECSPDCDFCHAPDGDPNQCPSKKVSHAAAG